MGATTSSDEETVLICGVPPEAFARIDELLGELHPRFTYDQGTLEMYRVLHGVLPKVYRQFMDVLSEQYLRHSYDGWTLEMMTPRRDHEWIKGLVARMLEAMALALDLPIQSTGSTTLSRSKHDRGIQPDESYYVGEHVASAAGETYAPGTDPPPDLAIEIETTNPVVPRLPLYAAIGVPEIWRWTGSEMEFLRLSRGHKYEKTQHSVAFPFIAAADVTRFLQQRDPTNENAFVRGFVEWARKAYHRQ
jgi:Uma2 family endonuclease